uniref:AAA-like domain-containing protein n=1 Tax=Okeania sp. SIO2F4 TaxID=2607790 RepID=UPI0025EC3DFF|nr:AAA-like domain-containing protein [Okeania sp. SIO2F4]
MIRRTYQVGGSLSKNAPTYVTREADTQLYQALNRGEFCYILNCRQMGKSSLLVRTYHQLKQQGFECASIDMTNIGSQNTTSQKWYQGIIANLWLSLKLNRKFSLKTWWSSLSEMSDVQKLSRFIEEVILVQFPTENICIFIDEIDSILGLNFTVDDFFALIRYCYNQRAINSEYNRLNFAIFGVATPTDLIQDRKRTPFNIGTAIELHGFTIEEIEPLAASLPLEENQAKTLLKEILSWTGGQPFLTNKLCQLVMDAITQPDKYEGNLFRNKNLYDWRNQLAKLPLGYGEFLVENLVRNKILDDWQNHDDPEHLRTIQNRLLYNPTKVEKLLGIYKKIMHNKQIEVNKIPEETELILSGLIVKESGLLKVKNRIYEQVFNLEWIGKKLRLLRPYADNFDAWIASQQTDKFRLLRGLALKDAEAWARGKSLSDLDYQYLDASVEI